MRGRRQKKKGGRKVFGERQGGGNPDYALFSVKIGKKAPPHEREGGEQGKGACRRKKKKDRRRSMKVKKRGAFLLTGKKKGGGPSSWDEGRLKGWVEEKRTSFSQKEYAL